MAARFDARQHRRIQDDGTRRAEADIAARVVLGDAQAIGAKAPQWVRNTNGIGTWIIAYKREYERRELAVRRSQNALINADAQATAARSIELGADLPH